MAKKSVSSKSPPKAGKVRPRAKEALAKARSFRRGTLSAADLAAMAKLVKRSDLREMAREMDVFDEMIGIAGQPAQHVLVRWTIWGPVLGPDHRGRARSYRWVAHSADRLAASVTPLEDARTIEEAFDGLAGRYLAFAGDGGDNVAHSLLLAGAKVGLSVHVSHPDGYAPDAEVVARAQAIAADTGALESQRTQKLR